MSNRCTECGQMKSPDGDLCERCKKAERVDELEEQVAVLEGIEVDLQLELEELRPKAQIHDRLRQLISLGLSPAQAVDVAFVHDGELSHRQWAAQRRVTPAAVYNNIADAKPKFKDQTELGEYPPDELTEEEQQADTTEEETDA